MFRVEDNTGKSCWKKTKQSALEHAQSIAMSGRYAKVFNRKKELVIEYWYDRQTGLNYQKY